MLRIKFSLGKSPFSSWSLPVKGTSKDDFWFLDKIQERSDQEPIASSSQAGANESIRVLKNVHDDDLIEWSRKFAQGLEVGFKRSKKRARNPIFAQDTWTHTFSPSPFIDHPPHLEFSSFPPC